LGPGRAPCPPSAGTASAGTRATPVHAPPSKSHVLVEPPARRKVAKRREAAAPRLFERGPGAGAAGRFRRGADLVSAGAPRSTERSENSAEHGDRVHEDRPARRRHSLLPARARGSAATLRLSLRSGLLAAETKRPRWCREASPGFSGGAAVGSGGGTVGPPRADIPRGAALGNGRWALGS